MSGAADVVEFYQRDEPRPGRTVSQLRPRGEGQPVEVPHEGALQLLSSEVGEIVVQALDAAHITRERAAGLMGISLSLFLRQLQNVDNQHVSLQRLYRLPNTFWRELLFLVIERRRLGRVRRRAIFEG